MDVLGWLTNMSMLCLTGAGDFLSPVLLSFGDLAARELVSVTFGGDLELFRRSVTVFGKPGGD